MRFPTTFALILFVFSSLGQAEESNLPKQYLRPKGATAIIVDKTNETHRADAGMVHFLPTDSNHIIAVYGKGEIIRWNVAEKKIVWRKKVFEKSLQGLEVTSDGNFVLVTVDRGMFKVLNTSDGETVKSEELVEGPDGIIINMAAKAPVIAYNKGKRLLDLNWRFYSTTNGFEFGDRGEAGKKDSSMVRGNAVSWDGKLVAMSNGYVEDKSYKNYSLDVYSTETNDIISSYVRRGEIRQLAFSPDAKTILFSGGIGDPKVYLYNFESKKESVLFSDFVMLNQLQFSADGNLVFCLAGLTALEVGKPVAYVRVANPKTGKLIAVIAPAVLDPNPNGNAMPSGISISSDGKKMALSFSDDAEAGEILAGLPDFVVFDMPEIALE